MAMNFPTGPTDGQSITLSNIIYTYNGGANVWLVSTNVATVGGGYFAGNNGDKAPENYGDVFRVHSNTISQNVIILSGNNATATGPVIVSGAQTRITIQTGSRMRIG